MEQELISTSETGELFAEIVQPVASTVFLVATWYKPARYWKLWHEQWLSREAAVKKALFILQNIRGHSHYTILEVNLPGV